MITDKQFEDAFTAAGGWFILTQFETVYEWTGEKSGLIERLYLKGFDKDKSGTSTRVSSLMRIIEHGRGREALERIRDSSRINKAHPEAYSMASSLIKKYYQEEKVQEVKGRRAMYDWDGNGRIDPHDIGQSVSMGLYDEEKELKKKKSAGSEPTGCTTMLVMIALIVLGALGIVFI